MIRELLERLRSRLGGDELPDDATLDRYEGWVVKAEDPLIVDDGVRAVRVPNAPGDWEMGDEVRAIGYLEDGLMDVRDVHELEGEP